MAMTPLSEGALGSRNTPVPPVVPSPLSSRVDTEARQRSATDQPPLAWQRAFEQAQLAGFSGWFRGAAGNSEPDRPPAPPVSPTGWTPTARAAWRPAAASAGTAQAPAAAPAAGAPAAGLRAVVAAAALVGAADAAATTPDLALAASLTALLSLPVAQAASSAEAMGSGRAAASEGVPIAAGLSQPPGLPVAVPGPLARQAPPAPARDELDAPSGIEGETGVNDAPASASADADDGALKFYAEWSAQGVRIWIGTHASVPLPLDGLVAQLQRMVQARGEQLLALVCNGQPVFTRSEETERVVHGVPAVPGETVAMSAPGSCLSSSLSPSRLPIPESP